MKECPEVWVLGTQVMLYRMHVNIYNVSRVEGSSLQTQLHYITQFIAVPCVIYTSHTESHRDTSRLNSPNVPNRIQAVHY